MVMKLKRFRLRALELKKESIEIPIQSYCFHSDQLSVWVSCGHNMDHGITLRVVGLTSDSNCVCVCVGGGGGGG